MRGLRFVIVALSAWAMILAMTGVSQAATVTETDVSPAAAHFPQNKQNESPMAVNPLDDNNVITGANDEIQEPDCTPATGDSSNCPFVFGVDTTGVYVTRNGGASWTQTILDYCPNNDPSDPNCLVISDGDPVVTFGPKPDGNGGFSYASGARAYFAGLVSSVSGTADSEWVAVSYSDDEGATWSDPVIVPSTRGPRNFNDKPAIWADQDPASPFFGNLYVSWTLFTGTFPAPSLVREGPVFLPEPIAVSTSRDGGTTWSGATRLSASHNNGAVGGRQFSSIRSAPNGDVYVIWDDAVNRRSAIVAARSTDGGQRWSRPFLVSYKSDIPSPLPGSSFRNNSGPMADIGPDGSIYVTWADYDVDTGHGVLKLAASTNNGTTWNVSTVADVAGRTPFYPAVAVSGSNVFIGFNALDDVPKGTAPGAGVVLYDAYYVLSTDSGGTFGAPVKISAAPSDPDVATANSLTAQFIGDYNGADAGTDGTFWFSWTDTRNGATCAAVDDWRASKFMTMKPNIYDSCPAGFGDSDIFVVSVTP
jgi:hypothetical protein